MYIMPCAWEQIGVQGRTAARCRRDGATAVPASEYATRASRDKTEGEGGGPPTRAPPVQQRGTGGVKEEEVVRLAASTPEVSNVISLLPPKYRVYLFCPQSPASFRRNRTFFSPSLCWKFACILYLCSAAPSINILPFCRFAGTRLQ